MLLNLGCPQILRMGITGHRILYLVSSLSSISENYPLLEHEAILNFHCWRAVKSQIMQQFCEIYLFGKKHGARVRWIEVGKDVGGVVGERGRWYRVRPGKGGGRLEAGQVRSMQGPFFTLTLHISQKTSSVCKIEDGGGKISVGLRGKQ